MSKSAPLSSASYLDENEDVLANTNTLTSLPSEPTSHLRPRKLQDVASSRPYSTPGILLQSQTSPTTSATASARNGSKQTFFSLFKKKEIPQNLPSPTRPFSSPPQNQPSWDTIDNFTTHETQEHDPWDAAHTKAQHFENEPGTSHTRIASASEPNLLTSNDQNLGAEYVSMIKEQRQIPVGTDDFLEFNPALPPDFEHGIASARSITQTLPKSDKRRKSSTVSSKSEEREKGFKNTMKNTMRKTSTFFKKLGNKQQSDNTSHHGRPSLPNFSDTTQTKNQTATLIHDPSTQISSEKSPTKALSDTGLTDDENESEHENVDEQAILQQTLLDYASVFEKLQTDTDQRRTTLYRNPVLGAHKSVPDNIGRVSKLYDIKNPGYDNQSKSQFLEPDDKRLTVFSLPIIQGEKGGCKNGVIQVKKDSNEGSSSKTDTRRENHIANEAPPNGNKNPNVNSSKSLPNSPIVGGEFKFSSSPLFSPESLIVEAEDSGKLRSPITPKRQFSADGSKSLRVLFKSKNEEKEQAFSKGSLMASMEERGLFNKLKRQKSAGPEGLSPTVAPKKSDKRLPDLPDNEQSADANQSSASRAPHTRQSSSIASSCYETASGSTATLHTAPPSPIADDLYTDSNVDSVNTPHSAPQIQFDISLIESPTEGGSSDRGSATPEVPEKDSEEIAWAEARITAKKCFDEDETFLPKETIAEYLGKSKPKNALALRCYMEYFNFTNLRLDTAFRRLCTKLYIKGETQQVDRILEAFAQRYWECNPKSVFGSADIVHAIAYSMLLLNTDLHVAQVSNKMSRSQFVKNTMAAVHAQATSSTTTLVNNSSGVTDNCEDDQITIASIETSATISTSTTARPRRSESLKSQNSNPNFSMTNLPGSGYTRQWDSELETLLKDIYSTIKSSQILQPLSPSIDKTTLEVSQPSLSLKRSLSHLGSYPNSRLNALKLTANMSRRPKGGGRNSPVPSLGSGGSEFDTINNRNSTQTLATIATTISMKSLRHQSSDETGFMSTVSEKTDGECKKGTDVDNNSIASVSTTESLTLYLSGAPYAKEGNLVRKHYWESTNKRAKDKAWKECFVVVENGDLRMYKFDTHSSNHSGAGSGAVGGGNWMANATLLGEVSLQHTITNALPSPGYNRNRPYVFALSLSNGGLYFFQAGTAELVDEWVSTCNYWASMMSKEPLSGGVSNMEYGWSRCDNSFDIDDDWEEGQSILSDGRSVLSNGHENDRIFINEWKAPIPPMVSSNLKEEQQLVAFKKYITDLENELESHKNYREPMTKLFHPRSSNYAKAISNWEKKSQWLLYEMVKYTTYIECIENSIAIRAERRKEREKAKGMNSKNSNEDSGLIPTITTTITEEERKKEQKRQEFRQKARQSLRLLHRATWTPGDGFSLNLPKELLYGEGRLSDMEDDDDEDESSASSGQMRSFTYPPLENKRVLVEEETWVGGLNSDVDYEGGQKWVDRFL